MSSYEYGASLYNTRTQAVRAMVEDYLTAQGLNAWTDEVVVAALADPRGTAAEMVADEWNTLALVGQRDEDGEQVYETVPTAELAEALEDIAAWRAAERRESGDVFASTPEDDAAEAAERAQRRDAAGAALAALDALAAGDRRRFGLGGGDLSAGRQGVRRMTVAEAEAAIIRGGGTPAEAEAWVASAGIGDEWDSPHSFAAGSAAGLPVTVVRRLPDYDPAEDAARRRFLLRQVEA